MSIADISPGATARSGADGPRPKPAGPGGVFPWLGFLGVTVLPVCGPDRSGSRAWVIAAGAGTTGMATLIFDTTRKDQT